MWWWQGQRVSSLPGGVVLWHKVLQKGAGGQTSVWKASLFLHQDPTRHDERCQRTGCWSLPVIGEFCTVKCRREVSPSAAGGTRGRLATGPSRAFASKAWGSGVARDRAGVQSGKTRRVERGSSASTQTALETVQIHPGAAEISIEVFVNNLHDNKM